MTLVWRIECVWVWFWTLEGLKMVENALLKSYFFDLMQSKTWHDFATVAWFWWQNVGCFLVIKSWQDFQNHDTISTNHFPRSPLFFTLFCFELAFGVNMKVLGNWISFPMALVWLENVPCIFSYVKNTPSRSWKNFTKI